MKANRKYWRTEIAKPQEEKDDYPLLKLSWMREDLEHNQMAKIWQEHGDPIH